MSPRARGASAPKIQRWVDVLAALLRRKFPVSLEELAREVPGYDTGQAQAALRRMFERDKDELRSFGVPIETVTDSDNQTGYRLSSRNFYLPYLALRAESAPKPKRVDRYGYRSLTELSFEPDELAAVTAAAARVRELGDPVLAEHVESAMRKLACDLPVDAAGRDEPRLAPVPPVAPDLLAELGDALQRRKSVLFDYHSMGKGETGRRSVHPLGLFFLNGHWYLAASDPGEGTVKNFRLNRMTGLKVNGRQPGQPDYEIPAGFDLREHARSRPSWELGEGDAMMAVVEFRGESGAAAAAERLGEVASSRTRQFRVRRVEAFTRWLLSFGGDLVPVSPPALVEEYQALVKETLVHHGGRGVEGRRSKVIDD